MQIGNGLKHTLKIALEYLKEKKVNALELPPYSPDLFPIKIFGNISKTVKQKRY